MIRTKIKRVALVAAALGLLAVCGGRAEAGFLGDTVTIDYIYPTVGSVYSSSGPLTVDPTASFAPFGNATATVSDSQLTFTAVLGTNYIPAAFNGFTITDDSRNPMIVGVTIDPVTSPSVGFNASLISFTSDSVSANFKNLTFASTDNVTLDISFASAVPEPSSLLMGGISVLCGLARYRLSARSITSVIPDN